MQLESKEPMRLGSMTAIGAILAGCLAVLPAQASMFKGDTLDKVANGIALVVLVVVPVVLIGLFWMVHVLPEKLAHKRHHPQRDAIHMLCLLSLVFGGLLWPLAWLWAYTKPVLYKMAYGTDQHPDAHATAEETVGTTAGEPGEEVARLRGTVEALIARGNAPEELAGIRDRLAALEPRLNERAGEAG